LLTMVIGCCLGHATLCCGQFGASGDEAEFIERFEKTQQPCVIRVRATSHH